MEGAKVANNVVNSFSIIFYGIAGDSLFIVYMTPNALKLYLSFPASNSFRTAAMAPALSQFECILFLKIDS